MNEASANAALDARVVLHDLNGGLRALNRVHAFIGRFVAHPSPESRDAHALWILHAHLMDHWDSTPRLAFLSAEPASGKSRALEVTALLVPRAVQSVNATPAYLFRKIGAEEGPPTILYDEIDTVFGPKAKDNEEVRGVLNAGHHRGATAGRCVVIGKTVTTEELPAYCAVAMAGLGWLPDTILTRSIIIRMRRRAPDELVEPFRRRVHTSEAVPVYQAVEAWARTVSNIDWPDLPIEVQDRDADVWESLVAIADIVGGDWPARARKAAVALIGAGQDAGPSLGILLLSDIKAAFDSHFRTDGLTSKELVQKLVDMEESPWGDLKGKPLDERRLARMLKQYSIKPATIYLPSRSSNPKGYKREDFHDAWSRYVAAPPSPQKSATSATSATVVDFKGKSPSEMLRPVSNAADGSAPIFHGVADIADVADAQGISRHECVQCHKTGGETVEMAVGSSIVHVHSGCINAFLADPCGHEISEAGNPV